VDPGLEAQIGELDGDRVGGFSPSSMTPGKQALFALTLILNESEEAWPLLIDQPEDDLDSRSIYNVLVGYSAERKTERQITSSLTDTALTGRIAMSRPLITSPGRWSTPGREGIGDLFDLGGIREHSCDLLDGGEEAFRKRRLEYKL
jgi:hypothetical protein